MTIFAAYPPPWQIENYLCETWNTHVQKFNCFYRLINKQITSNSNFGISEVRKMDQEAEIFKPGGTWTIFWHARLHERGRSRQPYWKGEQHTWMNWVNHRPQSHREHKSIEGMRTSSCSPNINEVSVQVKYKNKRYRSRYDIRVNLYCVSRT